MMRLKKDYFAQPTLDVAKDLLGKELVFREFKGLITETEAYIGQDDPACHAARGKTPRTTVMFGPAGVSYVYFIYGMYFCLNIVTEADDFPAAVLIRGLHLSHPESKNLNGPGKLCKHLGITRDHNGLDLTTSAFFYVQDKGLKPGYIATPRIGIKVGTEKLWRFLVTEDKPPLKLREFSLINVEVCDEKKTPFFEFQQAQKLILPIKAQHAEG